MICLIQMVRPKPPKLLLLGIVLLSVSSAIAQPPPKGPPAPKSVTDRIAEIRRKLQMNPAQGAEERELAEYAYRFLDSAARALKAGDRFRADRLADAGDACWRPIDHLHHIRDRQLPAAPGEDLTDHSQQVYFRLRLCDYFLQQISDPSATRLRDLARQYYRPAVQDDRDQPAEGEYLKCADDLTHALESLAQASLPDPPR